MTVTVERHYGEPVKLRVLDVYRDADIYSRKILLQASNRPVQFGLVEIDLGMLPVKVRREIESGDTPLGRVLIRNSILTRVMPTDYLRVFPDGELAIQLSVTPGSELFGRLGVIFAGYRPAIEVFELLAPIRVEVNPDHC
jgi:chorismate-pyruvate lyase